MSTEIVNWRDALATAAEKTAKEERPSSSVISLKSGIMTYQDQMLPNNQIECIIVSTSFARTWFDRAYDPDDKAPPNCFANALESMNLIPHENVTNPPSTACSEKACQYAVFGSAMQGNGPACKTRRKMIIMPVSGLSNPAEAEMATLNIPPTSGGNYSSYANKIAQGTGLPPWGVKTMITVKPHPKRQFEVTFETTGPVGDDEALAGIHGRIAEAEGILLAPYTYDKEEKAETGPKKKAKF
jgi:hypothetical protein